MRTLQAGNKVRMKVYGGEQDLVVVSVTETHINVCTPREWDEAKLIKREPVRVGFQLADVIDLLPSGSSPNLFEVETLEMPLEGRPC